MPGLLFFFPVISLFFVSTTSFLSSFFFLFILFPLLFLPPPSTHLFLHLPHSFFSLIFFFLSVISFFFLILFYLLQFFPSLLFFFHFLFFILPPVILSTMIFYKKISFRTYVKEFYQHQQTSQHLFIDACENFTTIFWVFTDIKINTIFLFCSDRENLPYRVSRPDPHYHPHEKENIRRIYIREETYLEKAHDWCLEWALAAREIEIISASLRSFKAEWSTPDGTTQATIHERWQGESQEGGGGDRREREDISRKGETY